MTIKHSDNVCQVKGQSNYWRWKVFAVICILLGITSYSMNNNLLTNGEIQDECHSHQCKEKINSKSDAILRGNIGKEDTPYSKELFSGQNKELNITPKLSPRDTVNHGKDDELLLINTTNIASNAKATKKTKRSGNILVTNRGFQTATEDVLERSKTRATTDRSQKIPSLIKQLLLKASNISYGIKKKLKRESAKMKSRKNTGRHSRVKYDIPVSADSMYAVTDMNTLRLNTTSGQPPTFVLLVTYARSGSTWLGEITSQAEDSFYVYEPLHRLIVQGYYKEGMVCYNNDTCRSPRRLTEKHKFAITTFYRIFMCQLTKLHVSALHILVRHIKTKNTTEEFEKCLKKSTSYMYCVKQLEGLCKSATHRIIKTIRVSMALVRVMLDMWPNLKVIHLVRDPRGITSSRLAYTTFYMSRVLTSHSRDMCHRMDEDTEISSAINAKYSSRLKIVLYEALAERPLDGANFIYTFLNMNFTETIRDWVFASSHGNHTDNGYGYFGTTRKNSTANAYRWKDQLTLYQIRTIDTICAQVYRKFGYMQSRFLNGVKPLDIPSRIQLKNFNGFN